MPKYNDFKSYIQDNYNSQLNDSIRRYRSGSTSGIKYPGFSPVSICQEQLKNLSVVRLHCCSDFECRIKIKAVVKVDNVTIGLGTVKRYDSSKTEWYSLEISARLKDGLHDFNVVGVTEYVPGYEKSDNSLDEFLVPYKTIEDLEEEAETLYHCYHSEDDEKIRFPFNDYLSENGLKVFKAPLPKNVFGRVYFKDGVGKYYCKRDGKPELILVEDSINAGTILVNENRFFISSVGSLYNTVAHEIAHWENHLFLFEILSLLGYTKEDFSCEVISSSQELTGVQRAIWWAEWQANMLAPRYLMPRSVFKKRFDEILTSLSSEYTSKACLMEAAIIKASKEFGVSKLSAKIRAIQLGYDDANASLLYMNGSYLKPMSFKRGSLGKNKTFIINPVDFGQLIRKEEWLRELIESELFTFVECVVCINDPQYIEGHYDSSTLTDFAREHLDECCLKFTRSFLANADYNFEFYGLCYLSRDICAAEYCECPTVEYSVNQDTRKRAIELQKLKKEGERVSQIMRKLPNDFSATLKMHMARTLVPKPSGRNGRISQLELAERTGISEDYIGQLCKDGKGVSLAYVCAICIGLHLHPDFSDDLIRKSNNIIPNDDEGFMYRYILRYHFSDSVEICNDILRDAGYKPWTNIESFFEKNK